MARLVVRIHDNSHPDPNLDRLRTKPGDVVEVCEDGHFFADAEYAVYRIINVPGVPAVEFEHLKAAVLDADENMIIRRKLSLDRVALEAEIAKVRAGLRAPLAAPDVEAATKARN